MSAPTLPIASGIGLSRTPLRLPLVWIVALGLLATVLVLGVGLGSSGLTPDRALAVLLGGGERTEQIIVLKLRLPRVLLAMEAGAALALAGALLQTATRNPLASPSILGIVNGAALGVVAFLWIFSDEANALTVSIHWQPLAATLGALAFAGLVTLLAWRDGLGPTRMVVYGIALGALASALVTVLMIVGPIYRANQALTWLAGSVQAAHWNDVTIVGVLLAMLVPIIALMPRAMDQLVLDDQSAAASGLAVTPTFLALMGLSVLLTATAVSFVGGVAFVGLLAPHAARLIVGRRALPMLVLSAIIGAMIVAGADLFGRLAFSPLEVPSGAITAILGAPYFIWLLIARGRTHA
ncbi:iron complex transport system permease protein [Devosia enhydra]|uniref:Iron complex transport system permease protein n=1 Tax=Devosia enhydra TaxID=665118 RepID=A0A1K2I1Q0_9HYPH|nr:iron ABC transporter permease [Devosia enhydra]SFZ85684.1 iron complex transport system permease protein [Devosia enhydra]